MIKSIIEPLIDNMFRYITKIYCILELWPLNREIKLFVCVLFLQVFMCNKMFLLVIEHYLMKTH